MAAARAVNAGEIAQACAANPQRIPELVRRARVAAVKTALKVADTDDDDEDRGGDGRGMPLPPAGP